MKKVFNIISTFLLIYFSFYYANNVSNFIKNKDPIMVKIKNNLDKYYKESVNATISNNTIIPGISGIEIDIDSSYKNMKKINAYKESMLVFKSIKPDISLINQFDKIIISGNQDKSNVSILLKIDDINILKKIINKKEIENINFIFSTSFIKENYYFLKTLQNNIIVSHDDNFINEFDIIDYCYTTNLNINSNCYTLNKYTIFPNTITHNYYFNTFKILNNGSIISYNITSDTSINEIVLIIKEINDMNYKIVKLNELLKE